MLLYFLIKNDISMGYFNSPFLKGKQLTFTMNSNKKSTFVFPQCESHTIIDNGIEYSNCIVTIVTEFNVLNGDITVLTNTGVLIDSKIEKMIYKGTKK